VRRTFTVPELFLGLLAIAVAVVLTAHTVAGTIRAVKRTNDVVTITGSARKPISADLAKWSLSVAGEASTEARAAQLLRDASAATVGFLRHGGLAAAEIQPEVVQTETIVTPLPRHRTRTRYRVSQQLDVTTRRFDVVAAVAIRVGDLISHGLQVSAQPLQYISTDLEQAKLDALVAATAEARHRADILVKGLGGSLGAMRSSSLGVYQITPRFSTEVSDYGISDTSTREKDVTAVVSATFAVKR
jgi:hypothetical protein